MTETLTMRVSELEERVLRLEQTLTEKKAAKVAVSNTAYEGVRGGLRMLIDGGFFDQKRQLGAVRASLAEDGYHYSRQAVHEGLTAFSKTSGPLVSLKEGNGKVYVKRK